MISEGVRQSIFFGCYGLTLKHLDKLRKEGHWYNQGNLNDKQKKYIDIIIASIVGGTIQSFLATPVEQFKVIQQAQRSMSFWDIYFQINCYPKFNWILFFILFKKQMN